MVKASCDAYVFAGNSFDSFTALIELESSGKIDLGIKQITDYAKSFTAKTLSEELKASTARILNRDLILIAFDGQYLWVAKYSLESEALTVAIDREDVGKDREGASIKLFTHFPDRQGKMQAIDEKSLVDQIAQLIRGHEKFQKNKALVMTILASVFGATQETSFDKACSSLKDSQDFYESHIYETLKSLRKELGNDPDKLLSLLYSTTAPSLYELSRDKGMDLYGFIYEELATKDTKKEQGEYYTPRHTIRPLLNAVARHYLKWDKSELSKKIVLDPFCGSGGFLYEYIHLQKTTHNLNRKEVDKIAKSSVFGIDKADPLAAYLNLYLIGDGSANLRKIATTINWRQEVFSDTVASQKGGFKVVRIQDPKTLSSKLKTRTADLEFLFHLYSPVKMIPAQELYKDLSTLALDGKSEPVDAYILLATTKGTTTASFGNVDLLLTNVPYGKIANPLEQFSENEITPYGKSLEANALRECIDFLRPAKLENGNLKQSGGVAITIIPDSILENPTNKPIRDYLISRCDILAIIGLPPFTFSPYAMEKTYALVFRKIAPEQFDLARDLSKNNVFMYYSLSDGKANSVNRFPTSHLIRSEIKLIGGKKKSVIEFAHNDFQPGFDSYFDNQNLYLSKLERSWDSATWNLNPEWDQDRVTEEWIGTGWKTEPGRKWGFYHLAREQREYREEVKAKALKLKLEKILPLEEIFTSGERWIDFSDYKETLSEASFSTKETETLNMLSGAEITIDESTKSYVLSLYRTRLVDDVALNPNDERYLGEKRPPREVSDILTDLEDMPDLNAEALVEYFRSVFFSSTIKDFTLIDKFDVIQGTQFSKFDAYRYPGKIPVYTAATDGPAYFCAAGIEGKVSVDGPALVWSRKGAKAGTIQLFQPASEPKRCYISDVSGVIKPKEGVAIDLTFLRYFIAGQVKAQIQAQDNNAQLNKSRLEALKIFCPENHKMIGDFLRKNQL